MSKIALSRRGAEATRRGRHALISSLLAVALLYPLAQTIGASGAAAAPNAGDPVAAPAVSGLPGGFSVKTVLSGLANGPGGNPTSFAYAPDGRIFVARKTGILNVWDHGVQHIYADLRAEVNSYQSRGFIGLALDPHFATTDRVYLLFTQDLTPGNPDSPAPAGGQLISLKSRPGQPDVADPASRVTLVTGIDSTATLHSVAGLRFGNDGSLFVGIGDGNGNGVGSGTAIKALDIDLLNGKILRIDPVTGRGISSNPYYQPTNPGSVRSRVFARGFRNPFRFTIDPTNGTLYVGDVGWNTWEMFQVFPLSVSNPDVNRNAGWPCYEGGNGVSLVQPDYAAAPSTSAKCHQIYTPAQGGTGQGALAPLYGYLHDDPGGENGSAIAGGPRYLGTSNYPDVYNGKVFIGDYARSRVQIVNLSTRAVATFGTAGTWGNPVDMQIAPDGNIAILAFGPGLLQEIVYTGSGNHAPVAVAHGDRTTTTGSSLTVHFSSAGSRDPDGDPIHYLWNWGDGGTPSASANPTHTYTSKGAYTASLLVTDSHGATATATVSILVGVTRPTAVFTQPASDFRFKIGTTIHIGILAVDQQDGVLNGDSITTQVDYWTSGHRYPVVNFEGATSSFVAADQGFVNAYYKITSIATDSDGLSTVITRNVKALTSRVSVTSNPSGITVNTDGSPHKTPFAFNTIIGSAREAVASDPVSRGGADWTNPTWTVAGVPRHTHFVAYTAPAHDMSLVVSYSLKPATTKGYRVADASGGVHGFGLPTYGDLRGTHLAAPIVAMSPSPNRRGYWLLGRDGGVFRFGDAPFYGSTGGMHLNRAVVGMTAPRTGGGYWTVASDGGIFAFGDAHFYGSTGAIHLNQPIVGMTPTPSGKGYWLVASDGGIFGFGDAHYYGSTGAIHLNQPIVAMAATPSGHGYEFAANDGGIFTFGDASYFGSLGGIAGPPVVGLG